VPCNQATGFKLKQRGQNQATSHIIGNGDLGISAYGVSPNSNTTIVAEVAMRNSAVFLAQAENPLVKSGLTYLLQKDGMIASAATETMFERLVDPDIDSTTIFQVSR